LKLDGFCKKDDVKRQGNKKNEDEHCACANTLGLPVWQAMFGVGVFLIARN